MKRSLIAALAAVVGACSQNPSEPDSTGRSLGEVTAACNVAPPIAIDPSHWFLGGPGKADYGVTLTPATATSPEVRTLKSAATAPADFATLMQSIEAPASLLGKRVRLSASVQPSQVAGWAGLWIRGDTADGLTKAFDNMSDRPISGTGAGKVFEVVVDLPTDTFDLSFGILLDGAGTVATHDWTLQEVCPGTPTTASWHLAGIRDPGDYAMTVDRSTTPESVTLTSLVPQPLDFGTALQFVEATPFQNKRLRFSAEVGAAYVADWAGLWMRIDGAGDPPALLGFDNMAGRPITGNSAWTRHEVVIDVPATAVEIYYGVLLKGTGEVRLRDARLEVVPNTVPVTSTFP